MPRPPIQSSVTKPVAWVWRCPHCQARVVVISGKEGLTAHNPCSHVVTPRRIPGGGMEMQYFDAE